MAGIVWDDAPKQSGIAWDEEPKNHPVFNSPKKAEAPSGIVRGMRDPLDGSAQLLTHLLPDSVVQAGNQLNNWLADKTGLVAKLPENGIDGLIRKQEADYQAQRTAAGETGYDVWRIAGNLAATIIPGAGATRLAQSANLGRVAQAAASGGLVSALNPVVDGDSFALEKAKQAGIGAIAGAGVQKAIGGISRLISPNAARNPDVQTLVNELSLIHI